MLINIRKCENIHYVKKVHLKGTHTFNQQLKKNVAINEGADKFSILTCKLSNLPNKKLIRALESLILIFKSLYINKKTSSILFKSYANIA